jgi:NO-binding membrane sensor protein with MHYT domain
MPLSYDPSLVLLSLALAIQGSYVCLRIALQINGSHGLKRRLLLTGAAFRSRSPSGACISSACLLCAYR